MKIINLSKFPEATKKAREFMKDFKHNVKTLVIKDRKSGYSGVHYHSKNTAFFATKKFGRWLEYPYIILRISEPSQLEKILFHEVQHNFNQNWHREELKEAQ